MLSLWLPVAAYMGAIYYVSAQPRLPSTGLPDVDLHALAYLGLTLLLIRALARGTRAGVTLGVVAAAWVIAVLYGVTDEWHQMYVPNRHAEVRDLVADAIGATAAGIVAKAWVIIRRL